jgi:hypothetical protein
MADRLEEAVEQLGGEQVAQWEANTELEALPSSTTRVWDLVLDRANMSSSLVVSLSIAAKLLEGRVNSTSANGVC